MSEITFDQIKDFQAQLAKQPAAGATARAVQNVGPQAASREPIDGEDMKPVFSLDLDTGTVLTKRKVAAVGSLPPSTPFATALLMNSALRTSSFHKTTTPSLIVWKKLIYFMKTF